MRTKIDGHIMPIRVAMICLSSPGIQWPSYGRLLWHHKVEIHPYQPCSGLPNRAQGRYWPFSIANKGHTKKLLKSKNPWNFVTETFKIGIIKWHLFFDLSNFYWESLISTTYFSLLGKRAWLFTKSKKGTTLHLKNRGLYFVLGLMMYFSLDKCKLIFCAAVEISTFWILD